MFIVGLEGESGGASVVEPLMEEEEAMINGGSGGVVVLAFLGKEVMPMEETSDASVACDCCRMRLLD